MIDLLKSEIESYNRYENNQLFYIDQNGRDYSVKSQISFSEWLLIYKSFPTLKVEGLEDNTLIKSKFSKIKNINSIHLFVKQQKGFSFDWHKDNTNVYLYVIKGIKKVFIDDEVSLVNSGDCIYIKKGKKHKVDSVDDTWALSVGCD